MYKRSASVEEVESHLNTYFLPTQLVQTLSQARKTSHMINWKALETELETS